jgi:hypothetical protein
LGGAPSLRLLIQAATPDQKRTSTAVPFPEREQ